MPRRWKGCGRLGLCGECRRRRYRARTIRTHVLRPVGASWQELLAALEEAFGRTTAFCMRDRAHELTLTENQAMLRLSIGNRRWALLLNSATWSPARRADFNRILTGEPVAEEILLCRGPTLGGRPQNDFSRRQQPQFPLVCRIVAWLPRDPPPAMYSPDPDGRDPGIGFMELHRLRRAIRANRISFPSQVPTFPRCYRADLQHKLVQLYFVFGWSSPSIARRYCLLPQQVRRILNGWKRQAAEAGYVQLIPPSAVAGDQGIIDDCSPKRQPTIETATEGPAAREPGVTVWAARRRAVDCARA